jgi:DNA-binding HxlR family transcriptional regulator
MDTRTEVVPQLTIEERYRLVRQMLSALRDITDRWTAPVVYLLRTDPQHYMQLKRQVPGITQKMLSLTLRKLEQEQIITRTVYPTLPPTVEYALTPLGETLQEPIESLFRWAWIHGGRLQRQHLSGMQGEQEEQMLKDGRKDAAPQIGRPDLHRSVQEVLNLITDKWMRPIMYGLREGPQRHSQLKQQIPGITQKMLTQTLRKLEKAGIILRTVYPTSPPTVEYALTELGETLQEPLQELCRWAWIHGEQLLEKR